MQIEFYNSVGGSAFLERLCREWAGAGGAVRRCHALHEADYRSARGLASRLALRWKMYPGFAAAAWRLARQETRGNVVRVVTTNPFFAPALVERAAGGRGVTINLVYDLFPEALVQSGALRMNSWAARRCADFTRRALERCDATVFLGEHLRDYAASAYGPARRSVVIPVGADGEPFRHHSPQRLEPGELPTVLYSGLLGSMHDHQTLAALWRRYAGADAGVRWVFQASGRGYAELRRAEGTRADVTWGGPLPEDDWRRAMQRAAVALVTIADGAERIVMPSKTYSALVAGQAILAICPRRSDLAALVTGHDCGWVVEPGDGAGLARAVARIAQDPAEVLAKRRRAYDAGHARYDMTPVAAQWLALFHELTGGSPGMPAAPSPAWADARSA